MMLPRTSILLHPPKCKERHFDGFTFDKSDICSFYLIYHALQVPNQLAIDRLTG